VDAGACLSFLLKFNPHYFVTDYVYVQEKLKMCVCSGSCGKVPFFRVPYACSPSCTGPGCWEWTACPSATLLALKHKIQNFCAERLATQGPAGAEPFYAHVLSAIAATTVGMVGGLSQNTSNCTASTITSKGIHR
jgi:hypothetical protein